MKKKRFNQLIETKKILFPEAITFDTPSDWMMLKGVMYDCKDSNKQDYKLESGWSSPKLNCVLT